MEGVLGKGGLDLAVVHVSFVLRVRAAVCVRAASTELN